MAIFHPKDFIETVDGLIFAVVSPFVEDGKVLCFLRYSKDGKLNTTAANKILSELHPEYLYYSQYLSAGLHAVPLSAISRHHHPREKLAQICAAKTHDAIEGKLMELIKLLELSATQIEALGVTGSLLISRQNPSSDIDLVAYDKPSFLTIRERIRELLVSGRLDNLSENDWVEAYARRGCEISLQEYQLHEARKYNKAIILGTKFDISLVESETEASPLIWKKCGKALIQAKVISDSHIFEYPAIYKIDHPEISEVLAFTHTYTGHVFLGEILEASGILEENNLGGKRLIIGSSREAVGEYVRSITLLETSLAKNSR